MTDYNTISDTAIDSDSIAIQDIFFWLRDNPIAITEGSAGAPKIQTAAINDSAVTAAKIANGAVGQSEIASGGVGRAELKTTTASASSIIGTDSSVGIALTGGTYSWWTASAQSGTGNDPEIIWGHDNTSAGTLGFFNTNSSHDGYVYVDERYVQSSPPYDLGDGEIPLFVFVMIDNATGLPVGVSVAQDPPWAYHGPTSISPDYIDSFSGRQFKRMRRLRDTGLTLAQAKRINPRLVQEFTAGSRDLVMEEVEITPEFKNSDISVAPNPWFPNQSSFFMGRSVIMLNPFATSMQRLYDLQSEISASEVRDLVLADQLAIDNGALAVNAPPGCQVMDFGWRLTGQR